MYWNSLTQFTSSLTQWASFCSEDVKPTTGLPRVLWHSDKPLTAFKDLFGDVTNLITAFIGAGAHHTVEMDTSVLTSFTRILPLGLDIHVYNYRTGADAVIASYRKISAQDEFSFLMETYYY